MWQHFNNKEKTCQNDLIDFLMAEKVEEEKRRLAF